MAESYQYEWDGRAGEISGEGVASYANGDLYEGSFARGKREGEGTMRYATGQERSGNWDNGTLREGG